METAFEATFADQWGDHLTVQPDLQYVIRPSGDRGIPDALIATLRLGLSY